MNKSNPVQQLIAQLLEVMGFEGECTTEEHDGVLWAHITVSDPRSLIGYKGETLSALEHLVRVLLSRSMKEEVPRVMVDINQYRKQRVTVVEDIARSVADQVRFSQRSATLEPMSAFERRVVHTTLAERSDVITESHGEGEERRVMVKPCP